MSHVEIHSHIYNYVHICQPTGSSYISYDMATIISWGGYQSNIVAKYVVQM